MIRIPLHPMAKPRITAQTIHGDKAKRYYAWRDQFRAMLFYSQEAADEYFEITKVGAFTAKFVIPMPKSWSKKKRAESLGRRHMQRPDADNLMKALKDALVVKDDCVYWDSRQIKIWGESPGILIWQHRHYDDTPDNIERAIR